LYSKKGKEFITPITIQMLRFSDLSKKENDRDIHTISNPKAQGRLSLYTSPFAPKFLPGAEHRSAQTQDIFDGIVFQLKLHVFRMLE